MPRSAEGIGSGEAGGDHQRTGPESYTDTVELSLPSWPSGLGEGARSDSPVDVLDPATATNRAEHLLQALAWREQETADHLRRTASLVETVALDLGWPEERVCWARFGALLHDIGKIAVSRSLMHKPGPLSELEQAAMRDHVAFGVRYVSAFGFPPIVRRIVCEHHERLDGSGYPNGLRGAEICEEARLLTIADIADAMLSLRPYKQAMSLDEVRRALSAGRGSLFDPALIEPVISHIVTESVPGQ